MPTSISRPRARWCRTSRTSASTGCYLSPVFTARLGSRHGYDVVDPTEVNPELGGRAGLEAFADDAHAAGLGVLLDIVPNHQAVATRNPRWYALLRDGRGVG